jgi:hypothetical protein
MSLQKIKDELLFLDTVETSKEGSKIIQNLLGGEVLKTKQS